MSISPAERVTDGELQLPLAAMDVQQLPETREFNAETLARTGGAVISQANAETPELAVKPSSRTTDGRDWDTQYSVWGGNVLGKGKTLALTPDEEALTVNDGRKFHGEYSTWNPYAGL